MVALESLHRTRSRPEASEMGIPHELIRHLEGYYSDSFHAYFRICHSLEVILLGAVGATLGRVVANDDRPHP